VSIIPELISWINTHQVEDLLCTNFVAYAMLFYAHAAMPVCVMASKPKTIKKGNGSLSEYFLYPWHLFAIIQPTNQRVANRTTYKAKSLPRSMVLPIDGPRDVNHLYNPMLLFLSRDYKSNLAKCLDRRHDGSEDQWQMLAVL
jgi:hypothetical protein